MMATSNSWLSRSVALVFLAAGMALARDAEWNTSAGFARSQFESAQARFRADANNPTNAWQFARAAFNLAEFSTNDVQRAELAQQGIGASRPLVAADPKLGAGHYYLAMNLGQLARTRFLSALRLVREMEHEFQIAAKLDARLDHAGPERNLGLLYRQAPGWPLSIGNRHKSQPLSEQAVQLAPDYPENHLNLIEAYLQWGDRDAARKALNVLEAAWPLARTQLTGDQWAQSWKDWSVRLDNARRELGG